MIECKLKRICKTFYSACKWITFSLLSGIIDNVWLFQLMVVLILGLVPCDAGHTSNTAVDHRVIVGCIKTLCQWVFFFNEKRSLWLKCCPLLINQSMQRCKLRMRIILFHCHFIWRSSFGTVGQTSHQPKSVSMRWVWNPRNNYLNDYLPIATVDNSFLSIS